jgi:ribosomal-protein-alanine N-acetyltransferase
MTPRTWDIRSLRAGDVEAVFDLERSTEGAAHWQAEEYLRMVEPQPARGVQRIATVAVVRGRVIGFIAGRLVLGDGEIENVAIAMEHRRKGVGESLVKSLLDECRRRKATVVRLEVRESNEAAQRLYRAAGFVQVGRRDAYYTHPDEAALVLQCKL